MVLMEDDLTLALVYPSDPMTSEVVGVGDDVMRVEEYPSLHLVPVVSVCHDHPVSVNLLVGVVGGLAWKDLGKCH